MTTLCCLSRPFSNYLFDILSLSLTRALWSAMLLWLSLLHTSCLSPLHCSSTPDSARIIPVIHILLLSLTHALWSAILASVSYADGYQPLWDSFMRKMESVAAFVPYMSTPGNHEVSRSTKKEEDMWQGWICRGSNLQRRKRMCVMVECLWAVRTVVYVMSRRWAHQRITRAYNVSRAIRRQPLVKWANCLCCNSYPIFRAFMTFTPTWLALPCRTSNPAQPISCITGKRCCLYNKIYFVASSAIPERLSLNKLSFLVLSLDANE